MSRIAKIEALPLRISEKTVWLFLQVVDDDGLSGLGEATLSGREAEVLSLLAEQTPMLVGTSATPAPLKAPIPDQSIAEAALSSALDQALWDLRGQRAGKPIWQLLGITQRREIPLYANINRRTIDRSPAGFAASARDALAVGFTRLKLAPFDGLAPALAETDAGPALIEAGVARIAAVRDAAGADVRVMVDCHWRFTEVTAERAIDRLAEIGVTWFECPLPETAETRDALRRLRTRSNERNMQLAGLEMSTSPDTLRPFLEAGCYDVVMPDIKYIGGFAGMLAAGTLCAKFGVGCAPHNPTGPICHGASLHAAAVLDGFDLLEHQYDESPLFDTLVGKRLPAHAGEASKLPSKPGLGLALAPSLVAELTERI